MTEEQEEHVNRYDDLGVLKPSTAVVGFVAVFIVTLFFLSGTCVGRNLNKNQQETQKHAQ